MDGFISFSTYTFSAPPQLSFFFINSMMRIKKLKMVLTLLEKGGGTEGPEACLNDYIRPMTQGGGAHVIKLAIRCMSTPPYFLCYFWY